MSTNIFNKWQNPDGTENYKCRAWVSFNGIGTISIYASGNVSSITDHAVGNYTVNFASAMIDPAFAVAGSAATDSSGVNIPAAFMTNNRSSSSVNILVRDNTVSGIDRSIVDVAIFR